MTHVAANRGQLRSLIGKISDAAKLSAGVIPGKEQEEDLACEFIGIQVLKRYISLHPTGEAVSDHLASVLNPPSQAELLDVAWEKFCAAYDFEAAGDDEHLSTNETKQALLGIDPELHAIMLEGQTPWKRLSAFHQDFIWGFELRLLPEDRREKSQNPEDRNQGGERLGE